MANPYTQGSESISQAEHISPTKTGDNIEAKRTANYIWDTNSSTWIRQTAATGGGGGGAVTIADGDDVALGAKADASATTDTGTFSLISLFKRLLEKVTTLVAKDFSTETTLSALNTKIPASPATSGKQDTGNSSLSSIDGKLTDVATQTTLALIKAKTDNIPAQGQALASASTPVVLPAAQISTLTPPAAITGYATASNQTDKSQFTKITDGTDTALVTASGEQNVLETNSAAIKTAVETIDNIVSGAGINQTQVGGTNIDTNSGSKSAGTQRVVLATDQPQLTNALKVDGSGVTQPISGSVTAIAQPGVDIGDVTVNNTTANPVPVQPPLSGYLNVSIDQTGNNNAVDVLTMPTVTETNSGAIKTAVETIDNAVSGAGFNITQFAGTNNAVGSGTATGALRVELPTNGTGTVGLNAGTNAIGKLSANSGVDIGDVDVTSAVSSTLDHGSNLDIDTSAEQITSTSFACKFGVTVKAAADNSGTIYIGNSDVTAGSTAATDGFPLEPGESVTLPISNPNLLYAIGSANNQKVFWSAA